MPESCSVFMLQQAFNPDDVEVNNLYDRYVNGDLLMGELKEKTSELIVDLLGTI